MGASPELKCILATEARVGGFLMFLSKCLGSQNGHVTWPCLAGSQCIRLISWFCCLHDLQANSLVSTRCIAFSFSGLITNRCLNFIKEIGKFIHSDLFIVINSEIYDKNVTIIALCN